MANQISEILDAKFERALNGLPTIIGNAAVNWSQERFIQQNWFGNSIEPWPARKRETKKTAGRKILIQTARLFRSIRIISTGPRTVSYGTDVPYAYIHNYGGVIKQAARSETFTRNRKIKGINKGQFKKGVKAGKGFSFKERTINMPRRQFIGNSPALVALLSAKSKIYMLNQMR